MKKLTACVLALSAMMMAAMPASAVTFAYTLMMNYDGIGTDPGNPGAPPVTGIDLWTITGTPDGMAPEVLDLGGGLELTRYSLSSLTVSKGSGGAVETLSGDTFFFTTNSGTVGFGDINAPIVGGIVFDGCGCFPTVYDGTSLFAGVSIGGSLVAPLPYGGLDYVFPYGYGIFFAGDPADAPSAFDFLLSVPEPTTWALTILGFGAVGMAARRRTRHATLSA
jgi:hypothetical protein